MEPMPGTANPLDTREQQVRDELLTGAGRTDAGAAPAAGQHTVGEGKMPTHTHEAHTHEHDHYHVTHHHRGGPLGEWEHRTHWHSHEHNHNALTHSHDYGRDEEDQQHGKEAHIHDHANPTESAS
jgi:hypothetical protein